MKHDTSLRIATHEIALDAPSYFIADIAANHDGDLERAKDLIWKSKEAGADCAKFQHFLADRIVSKVGFEGEKGQVSHQAAWKKSVVEVYDQYHTRRDWTPELLETCRKADIHFMTTPYDIEAVDMFRDIVPAFKIGSGDITYHEEIEHIAKTGKPVLLATGAATMEETEAAVELILKHNRQICLMQCNTNYTGSLENFKYVNLRVLQTFAARWPGMVLGFSDHTPGHSAVLGAVTLGARVIEKHFTDDNSREGPDHSFALNPVTWRAMVDATRELEAALGDGVKRIEENEMETIVIQRRALRLKDSLAAGTGLSEDHLEALRPCPEGAVSPNALPKVLGKRLSTSKKAGEELLWTDLA
ncbi:N-acetylneuraminate synthase family protein [Parvibaculum sp.]|jgi:sialic acid synthase SpsE|uniref:N-acetylneuraminate synthase family protein n=1 Tax=Parvibaculum sp. TaxID=2024848 RepID=UPI000C4973DA|nr:N-acetylneuraminate synthase family protein [Parvibaculum sp.]MAM94844.1 N-acetylneuraminate synthase [Parvibaculum sp.]|tara:strand:- start:31296 stop:32372 length:1077 start_codon:yes stop_codon:yes gene_type:complete